MTLEDMVLTDVKKVVEGKLNSNAEAVEFLVAFRASVNDMISKFNTTLK